MKSDGAANTGTAIRSLLKWLLLLLVAANIVVWTAWPFRDELVTLGILAAPPIERVDLDPRALPPIVQRPETSDAVQPVESGANGEPGNAETAGVEPAVPPDEGPLASPSAPEISARESVNGQPPLALLDCVVVGPVEGRDVLEAAATRLRSTGALVDSEASAVAPPEYVVYIEPAASLDDALLVLRQLEAQSIQDIAAIPSGTYENAVSVGVYRSRNRAHVRRDQIAALGYAVKVREREAGAYRLRVREVSADALGDLAYEPCGNSEAG